MKKKEIAVGTYKNSSKPKWKTVGMCINEALDFLDIDKTRSCASEKRGAIEVVRKHISSLEKELTELKNTINESYKMLVQHINIYEEYKERHREETSKLNVMERCYQSGRFEENLAMSKEVRHYLEAKFGFLGKKTNYFSLEELLAKGKSPDIQSIKFKSLKDAENFQTKVGFKTDIIEDDEKGIYYVLIYLDETEVK